MTNNHLILLTACYRFDRLPAVFDSIKSTLTNSDLSNLQVHWLICLDKYNGKGDYQSFLDSINKGPLESVTCNWSGKYGQKNYGGDMYNGPLTSMITSMKEIHGDDIDPWIYILDDDNILHPNLIYGLKLFSSKKPEAKIIWLPYQLCTGHLDRVIRHASFLADRANQWWLNWLDPSATLIRYSKLEEYGLYESGLDYDMKIGMHYMNDLESICFYDDVLSKNDTISFAYHNGNRSETEFEIIDNMFDDDLVSDVQLRVGSRVPGMQSWNIPLSKELGKIIYQLIKLEYKQKGLVK